MESNSCYPAHLCYFTLVSKNLVGQGHIARDINAIIDIHVANARY
ncbi:hypothetical protein yrohd0001_1760 [Yersinia rohdei ATCC 43380]|nr:hypothetical protein yrohd0001_1760 [Yersinia rohdei ATCC 43380]